MKNITLIIKGCTVSLVDKDILSLIMKYIMVIRKPETFYPFNLVGINNAGNDKSITINTPEDLFNLFEQVYYSIEMFKDE